MICTTLFYKTHKDTGCQLKSCWHDRNSIELIRNSRYEQHLPPTKQNDEKKEQEGKQLAKDPIKNLISAAVEKHRLAVNGSRSEVPKCINTIVKDFADFKAINQVIREVVVSATQAHRERVTVATQQLTQGESQTADLTESKEKEASTAEGTATVKKLFEKNAKKYKEKIDILDNDTARLNTLKELLIEDYTKSLATPYLVAEAFKNIKKHDSTIQDQAKGAIMAWLIKRNKVVDSFKTADYAYNVLITQLTGAFLNWMQQIKEAACNTLGPDQSLIVNPQWTPIIIEKLNQCRSDSDIDGITGQQIAEEYNKRQRKKASISDAIKPVQGSLSSLSIQVEENQLKSWIALFYSEDEKQDALTNKIKAKIDGQKRSLEKSIRELYQRYPTPLDDETFNQAFNEEFNEEFSKALKTSIEEQTVEIDRDSVIGPFRKKIQEDLKEEIISEREFRISSMLFLSCQHAFSWHPVPY